MLLCMSLIDKDQNKRWAQREPPSGDFESAASASSAIPAGEAEGFSLRSLVEDYRSISNCHRSARVTSGVTCSLLFTISIAQPLDRR
jgi:hypothetical protein